MAVTLNELVDIIEKSGLPMIDELKMETARPVVEEQIRSVIGQKYAPMFGKLDEEKKSKVEALANVDRQMSKIFGAGGKYQLMNPMATEQLATGLHNLRLEDFNRTTGSIGDLQKQYDTEVGDYSTLYDQLLPNKGEGYGGELAELAAILGLDLNNLGDVQSILNNNDKRPPIETFDEDRPSLQNFDYSETDTISDSGMLADKEKKKLRGSDVLISDIG